MQSVVFVTKVYYEDIYLGNHQYAWIKGYHWNGKTAQGVRSRYIRPNKLGTTALDRQRSQLYTGDDIMFTDVSPGISLLATDKSAVF